MNSSKIQLCRLCLQSSDNVVNIWETYQDSTIASILIKHFWFPINKDDERTEFVCDACWIQTKTFHQFYKQIEELQRTFRDTTVAKCMSADMVTETDVNIVKCEETELSESIDLQINTEHNDSEYDDVDIAGESEIEQSEDEQNQCAGDGQQDGKLDANMKASSSAVKERLRLSPSEKAELEGQIRDLFKMDCELCSDVKFRTLSDAEKHYRSVHQKGGYIMCCGRTFHNTCTIVEHIRYHLEQNEKGLPEVEPEIPEWFAMKCDICSDTVVKFETLTEMRRHFRMAHNRRGYLRCTCSKKCGNRALMLNHIRWHTNSDVLRCGQCDKIFKCKFSLKCHIANHIPHDSRAFKCTLCKSRFALATSLRSHVKKNHTAKTGEKFDCDKCTKSFKSSFLLSYHIRNIHESTTEYVCEICARSLKTKTALQNHFDRFHSSKPPSKVQCDVCGVWVRGLYQHRRLHERTGPINCPICNKPKPSKEALRSHISYVHGEKQHKCQLCNKAFVCLKNLKEHLATHTNENLYDCPYCDKKFKSNANMYKHRKNAHLTEWARDVKDGTIKKLNEQIQPSVVGVE